MKVVVLLFFVLGLLENLVFGQTPFSGPTYQSETANEKTNALQNSISADTTSGTWYSLQEAELFIEPMNLTFSTLADDMPYQFLIQRRPKLIHSVGAIANARWTALSSSFTGILGEGCRDLFIRFSLAAQPGGSSAYTPAISIKCLRNGIPSGDIFGMYSLQGQDSWNFFKHDYTNHVPDLSTNAGIILQRLRARFADASSYPVMIGLSNLAKYTENGTLVQNPKFPFRLIFHPVSAWHTFYPDSQPSVPFEQQLASTLKPSPLYQIYAQVEPDDDISKFVQIGQIDLTSTATTSKFGDTLMFFQHTRFEDDLVYRPDWAQKAQDILAQQRATDNYVYPDLPWNK